MRKYLSLANVAAQRVLAYPANFALAFAANLLRFIVFYYFWAAVYAGRTSVQGFTWPEMRTYVFVSYLVSALLSFRTELQLSQGIRDGSIVFDLAKPLDFQKARLAEALGASLVEGVILTSLVGVLVAVLWRVQLPASPIAALAFLVSVLLGYLIKFLIAYMTGLTCFWTHNVVGLVWARLAVTEILSGAIVPLTMLPGWLRAISLALPFNGIVYVPLSIYLGRTTGPDVLAALAGQLAWAVVLWFAARVMWSRAIRVVTVQGG